jgi:hypothetical protein
MREILAYAFAVIGPFVEVPEIKTRFDFIEDNFFVLGSAVTLSIAFLMWVNI